MPEQNNINSVPKYYQLKSMILQDIQTGKYKSNSKLPSITELINKYSISNTTVKRVINELSNEGIIYKIQGKGCFISGPGEALDKPRVTKNQIIDNKRIAFVMTGIMDEFHSGILRGVLDAVQSDEYNLQLYASKPDYSEEMRLLSRCINEPISGLLFLPRSYSLNYKHLFELIKKGVSIVLIDNSIKKYDLDYISSDNKNGAKQAVDYLIQQGHKNILCIAVAAEGDCLSLMDRVEGYKSALIKNRIKVNEDMILHLDFQQTPRKKNSEETSGKHHKKIQRKIKELKAKKIKLSAIFTTNNWIAIEAHRALQDLGLKVPENISLTGFDDSRTDIQLTTVRQNSHQIGYHAAKTLLKRLKEKTKNKDYNKQVIKPIRKKIKTELIIRETVRKIK